MAKKKPELTSEELLEQALVREEDWPYQVPGNWVWVRLGEIMDVRDGTHDTPKYVTKGIPLITSKNLSSDTLDFNNVKYISIEDHIKICERSSVSDDDILMAMIGTIGNPVVVKQTQDFSIKNVALFKKSLIIQSKLVCYYLKASQQRMKEQASGGLQPFVSLSYLRKYPIPLPPLAEQQRIVDRIESLFDKLDQAKDLIQDVLDSFETRKAAILHQAFTGQLTKKWREAHGVGLESWEETKSESIFEYVTSGSRGWAQYYNTKGSVFIRMGNLDHGTIELDLADIQYVKLPENVEGKRSKVEKNDVLISITADVGMVGLVRNENMDAYINQHVALARPVKSVNAEFIAWFLVSDLGLRQLQTLQRGATKIGLTLGDIRNLTIKLPCLSEQTEIVRIIDDLFAKEQNAKDLIDLIDQIEAIKKTILSKAFRGELGTNEVEEESAVYLLKAVLAML